MYNLIIIDDDHIIRNVIKIQLAKTKCTLFEAENKAQAMEIIEKHPIHLVLCDIKIKESNGFEILRILHETHPEIKVIMLTGFIDKEYLDESRRLGCYEYITKPVKKEKLISILCQAVGSDINL